MIEFNENTFKDFCLISQQVQSIQNRVERESICPNLRVQLHDELERVQDSLKSLRGPEIDSFGPTTQFEEMERRIISLYRGIEEKFEETEVSRISRNAIALPNLLIAGKLGAVAQKVDQLKGNIADLFAQRRPSLKNRKIVQLSQKLVEHTERTLAKGRPSRADLQRFQLLQTLLREAIYEEELMTDPFEAELSMELCEIGDLYRQRRLGEATVRLQTIRSSLSESQQKEIDGCGEDPELIADLLLRFAGLDPRESALAGDIGRFFHILHA